MKSLMLKLLTIALIASFANANALDNKVVNFLQKSISTAKSYKVKSIIVQKSEDIKDMAGWKVYFVKIELDLVGKNKTITIPDKIFTNGQLVTKDMSDINTGRSIKNRFSLDFDEKFYRSTNIIAGVEGAKNKLVVFSDPLCPFCTGYLPEVIEFVKKHSKEFVLYYYHFPLSFHPNAETLVKTGMIAQKLGIKDVDKKMYEEVFDFDRKDDKLVIDEVNKLFGTKITLEDLKNPEVIKHLEDDKKIASEIGVNGTPTLFVNGKMDKTRNAYKKLLK